jgi:hypothetical protein|tara:strand:- start:339 stop:647 length:309 start_codon:yes stop_codon:yes gene_type:complete
VHKKTSVICGESDLKPDFEAIGNNPNFVFENDPSYETVRLFDADGNIVNVNSWLECANYVNGGWTDYSSDFVNGEQLLFFALCGLIVLGIYLHKKYNFLKRM